MDNTKMLIVISKQISSIDTTVKKLDKIICGNGEPGLVAKFNKLDKNHQIVYDRQKHCIANQKEKKIDIKWMILLALTIIALIKDVVF